MVARSPSLGAPGYGARARSKAAHLAAANSRIHVAAKRTMWPLVAREAAALQLRALEEAAKH
jgi:hypothetical protein